MVFGFGKARSIRELTAQELDAMLRAGAAVVVDVREVDEFAAGHIPGAINMPLSTFQPSKLPDTGGKKLVLTCLGGKRSAHGARQMRRGSGCGRHASRGRLWRLASGRPAGRKRSNETSARGNDDAGIPVGLDRAQHGGLSLPLAGCSSGEETAQTRQGACGPRWSLRASDTVNWQDVSAEIATVDQAQVLARIPGILTTLTVGKATWSPKAR